MKKGEQPSENIKRFVIDTSRSIPDLSYQQLAELVHTKYGKRIDQSSIGRYIRESRAAWKTSAESVVDFPQYSNAQIKKHHDTLLAVLDSFQEISVFPASGEVLEKWLSRPDEPKCPIAQGHICRDGGNDLVVKLFMDDQLEWEYLQQHLTGDPVWKAIEDWKSAMAEDIMARSKLYKALSRQVVSGTGLEIVDNIFEGGDDRAVLGPYYLLTLYDQVFSRAVDIRLAPKQRQEFVVKPNGEINLFAYVIALLTEVESAEDIINFLLDAQMKLTKLPSARSAKAAYHQAEECTSRLKRELKRILLAPGLPPDSRCDGCIDWLRRS